MEAESTIQKWTYNEMLEKLPAESRYEIINNELYDMSPAPNPKHQIISGELEFFLQSFTKKNPIGRAYHAPFDVFFDANNIVQPDIFFILNESVSKISDRGFEGAPDLIIEILSPSSVYRDQVEKKALYEKFQVPEYWVIDPANKVIEVLSLNESKGYFLFNYIVEKGIATSSLLEGFQVNAEEIFTGK